MNTNFEFNNKLIVRTPKLTQKDTEIDLMLLLEDESFLESVYIASPGLYNECLKLKQGGVLTKKEEDKVKSSLTKYHYRMGTRSTPFGLFSGCHVGTWTDEEAEITISKNEIKRHTRLDMHYLCGLSQNLALRASIRENIKFFTNNSIYIIGTELRYVEYSYQKDNRSYQICSVAHNEYLEIIIEEAKSGKYIKEIVDIICDKDQEVSADEVLAFLNELINSQILISELEPSTTGNDFLVSIISVLEKIEFKDDELNNLVAVLNDLDNTLRKIDNNEFKTVEGYKHIVEAVEKLGVPYDESKLFHTDIYKKEISGGIRSGIKAELAGVAEMLNKITAYTENGNLKNFKDNFCKRYEEKEMPLLKVLDTETGIGYLNTPKNQDITPLIDDILLPSKGKASSSITWNELEQLLHKKTIDSTDNVIEILDEDLKDFEVNWTNLPPSFPMMFRILSEKEIFIESCGGSSAINLLGRFANGDAEINQVVQEIADKEQALDENVVFAEIIHLPENRIGNILVHPPFRKYEIPYLSNSGVDDEHTIEVSDLYVSVKNNKVVLRSKRLNKIVVPRLSNAHNYSNNALPVYQFLCDLQNQGKRGGLFFHWGGLGKIHQKFPRVKYKGCILSLAQWNIRQADVKDILNSDGEARRSHIDKFLKKWDLPRFVVLAEGDNELFIDFESEKLINIWVEYIKKRNLTILKEFIPSTHGVVDDLHQEHFTNQVIALIQSKTPSFQNLVAKTAPAVATKRRFSLGSEWLYFKIYCGVRSADKILTEVIKPVSEELKADGKIDKWFFIRYNDPDFHLRVRFHLTDITQVGHIIQTFNQYADQYMEGGTIWKIQNDTYNREIERYGSTSMEITETMFYHDSAAVVNMISTIQNDERENFRWMWAIKSVDELLKSFGISLDHRFEIMDSLRESFAVEFNSNKLLKVQLDSKYRQYRAKLDKWLSNDGLLLEDPDELQAIRALFERSRCMVPLVHEINNLNKQGDLEITMANLLGSLIHMIVNRVITSQPRLHEMIIYDFMSRLYKSTIAIAKQTNNKKDAIEVSTL
jgi:thiopeptide-type bacteriocin biosynthesis protein